MADNFAEEILKGVRNDLSNLGGSPSSETVEEVVVRYAKQGAGDDPLLQQQAADLARQQLDAGMAPDAAAVSAATQTYQEAAAKRPSLDEQMHELLGYRPQGSQAAPGQAERDKFFKNHGVKLTSSENEVLNQTASALSNVGASPELAAQAQLAIANAGAGGTLLPTGLDIHGRLTATVHDTVHLDLRDSQIKTTVGPTTYTHGGRVWIEAHDVKLTANEIHVNAATEVNTVNTMKVSTRSFYTGSIGSFQITTMPVVDTAATLIGVELNGINASFGTIRVGTAYRMNTRGFARRGMKGATYETAKKHFTEKFNSNLLKFVLMGIIL